MSVNYTGYAIQGVRSSECAPRRSPRRSAEVALDRSEEKIFVLKVMATLAMSAIVSWSSVSSLSHLDSRAMSAFAPYSKNSEDLGGGGTSEGIFANLGKAFAATPAEAAEVSGQGDGSGALGNLLNAIAPEKSEESVGVGVEEIGSDTSLDRAVEVQPAIDTASEPRVVQIVTVSKAEIEAKKAAEEAKAAYSQAEAEAKAYIYEHESNNKLTAVNEYGCIGLGQDCSCYGKGPACVPDLVQSCPDWRTNRECQDEFWEDYMSYRYGSWQNAKAHWTKRVPIKGIDKGHWW
jgi:hypothetical protein